MAWATTLNLNLEPSSAHEIDLVGGIPGRCILGALIQDVVTSIGDAGARGKPPQTHI